MLKRSTTKIILAFSLIAAAAGGYYAYTEYNRRNPSMADAKASFQLTATDALAAFESKADESTKMYVDQVLEVSGSINKIEKDEKGFYTIVLGDAGSMSSVRCVVDSLFSSDAAKLSTGTSAKLRGVCVGYTADDMGLGADLLLNRCYPIQ
ncbi:MAG: hypothetical protein RL750_762 [Bacteroidota bacterium]